MFRIAVAVGFAPVFAAVLAAVFAAHAAASVTPRCIADGRPQGGADLPAVLEREGVTKRVPALATPPLRDPSVSDLIRAAGPDASRLAASMLVPAAGGAGGVGTGTGVGGAQRLPGMIDLMEAGMALHGGNRHGLKIQARMRDVEDIEEFLDQNHREVRRAIGFDLNFTITIPVLHGYMEQVLFEPPNQPRTQPDAKERKLILHELERAAKVDVRGMHRAALAMALFALQIEQRRDYLAKRPTKKPRENVTGTILLDKELPFGRLVVGGPGRNVYDCTQIDVIIDVGGDDVYEGPAGGAHEMRRYSVCIDLAGKDTYRGGSGSLGSATYGLGMLIDFGSDSDHYEADLRSAGFGAAGVGVFVDAGGNDELTVGAHSGGVGLFGIGQCIDLSGDDRYQGGRSSFGVGLPGGLGMFTDVRGSDERKLVVEKGKANLGFGAARGVDARLRGDRGDLSYKLRGGFGVFVDYAGKDSYTGGDLAFGVGDRGGLGVFVDAAGDDAYIASGLSLGAGRGGGLGIFLEVAGDDHYFAAESLAASAAASGAFFEDWRGDDIYEVTGAGMGRASAGGYAFFQDLGGKNQFRLKAGELAFLPEPGGFALFRSLGKGDQYQPADRDPGAKGRRVAAKDHLELYLTR